MSTKIPIFCKKCPKSFHKILQKTKYIRKYDFYKMCTSGRINFFWGVFSAFMVRALTLISTALSSLVSPCVYSTQFETSEDKVTCLGSKNYYYIYMRTYKTYMYFISTHHVRNRSHISDTLHTSKEQLHL